MQLTSIVIKALRRAEGPVSSADLQKTAGSRATTAQVLRALDVLISEGKVIETPEGYSAAPRDGLSGRLSCSPKGFGFVATSVGDVFVPAGCMNGALHGDEVVVRVSRGRPGPGNTAKGKVVEVTKRANSRVVGTMELRKRDAFLTPANKRLSLVVRVPSGALAGAGTGDVVVVDITKYPTDGQVAEGRVSKVIGALGEPGVDIDTIVWAHDLPTEFSEAARKEAAALPLQPEVGDPAWRDLRDLFTVTIDGLDAKDFDDAVSLRTTDDGFYELWVHIANVSHYVRPGSAIDADALERGTSVYLPDRVLPMLPEALSNELCSLKPDVERLSLSIRMKVGTTGEVVDYEIVESVIRSDHRLTYEQVDECLKTQVFPSEKLRDLMTALHLFSELQSKKRIARGSLEFETIEPKIILDERFWPTEVLIRERTIATQIIEEAMILANETVAEHMFAAMAPMVYRVHDKPDAEAVVAIGQLISQLGYPVHKLEDAHPRAFQALIDFAHNRPERLLINSLLLRAMSQAKYSAKWQSHFGLASQHYTHFTSPIRRYPDLIVHRAVKAQLAGALDEKKMLELAENLPALAAHCSVKEREAQAAEREAVDVKMAQYMLAHIGEEYDAVISGVAGFGFFVQLPNSAEGLVAARNLTDDYYRFEANNFLLRGERTGKTYRLGQSLRVRLVDVSVAKREVDFAVVER